MRGFVRSLATAFVIFTAGATSSALADPPARVGRLSLIEGDVTFHDTAAREAAPATLNWPVTGGAAISTAPGARAEVRIGSTAVRLDGATALEFVRVDDQAIRLRLEYGAVTLRVRSREVADELVLETEDARVRLSDAGRYRFEAGRAPDTTAVTVFQGAAHVDADGIVIAVKPGRRAEVGRGGRARVVEAFADEFDDWTLARDRRDDAARSGRYVSPETTGHEALDDHGDWHETADYGPVWYPRAVPVGWAPYRAGRWAWVEPWGWTWIDEAPWGFAPFHYGRWALVSGVWGWVPGAVVARPVYAPALVGWVGRPGWSVTIAIGAVHAVGWFPLAPREVFIPAYRCSSHYVRSVNVAHVTNIVNAVNVQPRYVHRHVERAVTAVPAAAVSGGQHVGRSAVRVRHADLVADTSASNAPPVAAARPPRQFGAPRRDDDGRWTRRPQPVAAPASPAVNAPAASARVPPAAIEGERRRDEAELRREPRLERERPAPTQPTAAVPAPIPPVAGERELRRDEPDRRPEPRIERERAGPLQSRPPGTAQVPPVAVERERAAPQSTPPVTAPVPPVAVERERRRDETDRRPGTQVERDRPAPQQRAPAATAPVPPVVVEGERRRGEPSQRPEPRVERERPAPPQPTPMVTAPVPPVAVERERRRDESIRRPEPPIQRERAVAAPVVATPAPPRVLAPPAPRERADRREEPRPAVVAPAPRPPAPMPPPAAAVRAPASPPSIALPQAASREQRAPPPEGSRGQPREARRGERRGG